MASSKSSIRKYTQDDIKVKIQDKEVRLRTMSQPKSKTSKFLKKCQSNILQIQPIQSLYMLRAVKTGCTFSRSECSSKSRPTTVQYALANTPYHRDSQDQMNVLAKECNRIDLANSSICYGQYIKSMCPIYFVNFKMGYLGCGPINGFIAANFTYCFGHPNEGSGQ